MAVLFPNESEEFNQQMEEEGKKVAELQMEVNDIDALLNEIANIKHDENVVINEQLLNKLIKYTLAYREASNITITNHFNKVSGLLDKQTNDQSNMVIK